MTPLAKELIDFWRMRRKEQGLKTIIQPCHEIKADALMSLMYGLLPTPNLMILEPPRVGKTDLVRAWEELGLSEFPDSEFLNGSYSQDLATTMTKSIRDTLTAPWYREQIRSDWGATVLMRGTQADGRQDYFQTVEGGHVKGVGAGTGSLGFGAGKLRKEFGGAIICFPEDEKVWTEKGKIPIGEIVNNSLQVNIFCRNLDTNDIELQPIEDWFKNPGSDIIEIGFGRGASIKCTPGHKIYTESRGYVKAAELNKSDIVRIFPPDSFYNISIKPKSSSYSPERFDTGANILNLFFRKLMSMIFPGGYFSCFSGNGFPCLAGFNLSHHALSDSISFSDIGRFFETHSNFNGLLSIKFCAWTLFQNRESTVPFRVGDIFRSCPITNIIKKIIGWISIKMSDFMSMWAGSKKSKCHSSMNIHSKMFIIDAATEAGISPFPYPKFHHPFWKFIKTITPFVKYSSFFTSDPPNIGYAKSKIPWYGSPLFIKKIGHVPSSYCLSVRCHHNFYVGESQAILVSNCDDPIRAQDKDSAKVRKSTVEWLHNSLESRRNRKMKPMTPIVLDMQRLGVHDPAGHFLATERHRWTVVQIPAHDEAGKSIWPARISMDELMHMKEYDNDTYLAQYMQSPSSLLFGTFLPEWWNFWTDEKEVEKRITLKFITADTAFKEEDANDYTVFQCWGAEGLKGLYLIDQIRDKWTFPDLIKNGKAFLAKHTKPKPGITPALEAWVEDRASGTSLVQTLRREGLPFREWLPPNKEQRIIANFQKMAGPDKTSRGKQASIPIQYGRVFLPYPGLPDKRWAEYFVTEHTTFSTDNSHLYDDVVDAETCANLIWQQRGGGVGPLSVWPANQTLKWKDWLERGSIN